jgi:hypothetical protein
MRTPVDVLTGGWILDISKPTRSIGGLVRKTVSVLLCLALFAAGAGAAQKGAEAAPPGEPFVGIWSGSWQGAGGSGGFELVLEKAKDGSVGGRVSVTGEPTYKASLESASFEGPKMTARYKFPPEESMRVVLVATFEGNAAEGTWALLEAGGTEVANGTWTVKKK